MTSKNHKIKLETFKDKSTLVKLLAEEDLSVIYQKVPTASFNVKTREVTLPIWKDKSEDVMDMMSLHEVGHALYTPEDMMKKGEKKNIKHSFLNVLEDVRIEKMIQDKYLGSVKVFKKAYKELIEKDFFNIKDKDLSKLNLIDRINMHYKNVPDVPFLDKEQEWVKKANETKTPDDVVKLAEELQAWMKAQPEQEESDDMFSLDLLEDENGDIEIEREDDTDSKESDEDSGDEKSDEDSDSDSKDDSDLNTGEKSEDESKNSKDTEEDDSEIKGDAKYGNGIEGDEDVDGISAKTDKNMNRSIRESLDKDATEIEHLNIPKVNLDEAIIDYKRINKELSEHYIDKSKRPDTDNFKYMEWIKKDILKYHKEQAPTISYMVKEFEMKKAADQYKRATISKTGQLNMDKLHSYSYNEDIFLKMTNLPGATNHGLVMFVDWSGSMADNFHNTIKQTLNLVWFCKRVNIPFEVYGFTNGYSKRDDTNKNIKAQKPKENDLIVNECTLLNILSSRATKNEFNEGLINLWAISNYYNERYGSDYSYQDDGHYVYPIYIPSNYTLHSTPLNHSIVYAMELIPKFKKDNGIQKVHTVFLTDGSSNSIDSKYEWSMDDNRPYSERYEKDGNTKIPLPDDFEGGYSRQSIRGRKTRISLVDPITKKKWLQKPEESPYDKDEMIYDSYAFTYEPQTHILLQFLKARVQDMNIVNFFIAGRNKKGTIQRYDIEHIFGLSSYNESDLEKIKSIQKEIKKNNCAVCTTQGWDELYVLPGGEKLNTSNEDMSKVEPGAKKSELKKAFQKMSTGRKMNRPLLNKFIGMIA
jgi:hypothetical protein